MIKRIVRIYCPNNMSKYEAEGRMQDGLNVHINNGAEVKQILPVVHLNYIIGFVAILEEEVNNA